MDQIKLKPAERQAVSDAARLLRKQFPVQQVILFGSKARGDDDPESDADLLVLTSLPVTRAMRQQMREAVLPIEMSSDVWMGLTVVWAEALGTRRLPCVADSTRNRSRRGRRMSENPQRAKAVEYWQELAAESLASAKDELDQRARGASH